MINRGVALSILLLVGGVSTGGSTEAAGQAAPSAQAPQTGDLADALLRLPPGRSEPEVPRPQAPRYTRDSPPPDDAPIEVLGQYWSSRGATEILSRIVLSAKARESLFEAASQKPAMAGYLADLLPRTPAVYDRMKEIYDKHRQEFGPEWTNRFAKYLMRNTPYLREELVSAAGLAADHPTYSHVEHAEELEMLAAADFSRAEPLLRRFAADAMPRRALLAKALLYEHGSKGPETDSLNVELKTIVENINERGNLRNRALQGLLAREWPGREEWYLGLFRDSTMLLLLDGNEGSTPLCGRLGDAPEQWIPVVIKLVGNADRAVHDNAVQCLNSGVARRDALERLLPWLHDPQWATSRSSLGSRLRLIQFVSRLGLRESIPGLIAVLNQNVPASERSYAAESLALLRAVEAAPALRQALETTATGVSALDRSLDRRRIMQALVDLGGLSDSETVAALEAYAAQIAQSGRVAFLMAVGRGMGYSSLPDPVAMGQLLAQRPTPPAETAIGRILIRATELESTNPGAAAQLLEIAHGWPSAAADRDIARRIAANTAQAGNVQLALRHRDTFRANAPAALRDAAASSGIPAGVFAVLSGDRQREENILKGADIPAIRALLASARSAGAPLPFDAVERVYNSGEASVARAAEAYLTANDGPSARKILNARFKGTVIFGATEPDDGSDGPGIHVFAQQERQLLETMQGPAAPDETFAFLRHSSSSWTDATRAESIVIERRGETVTSNAQWEGLASKSLTVSAEEFGRFKAFLDVENIENLGPFSALVFDIAIIYEYVHLTRTSARRVYMRNLGFGGAQGSIHDKLGEAIFELAR